MPSLAEFAELVVGLVPSPTAPIELPAPSAGSPLPSSALLGRGV
jgi:hypothetical protein